jgi:hypothetical protein
MPDQLFKLSPHRDLQSYFERPSAIAAISDASETGFCLSGTWRQQFDWAVVEWNRDNVFEHPSFRYLPDGDLSGLTLSYEETRSGCMVLDSSVYPVVDWPFLRIWTDLNGVEKFHRVRLKDYASPVEGSYAPATAEFELLGLPAGGDYVGLAWLEEHHTYQVYGSDSLESIAGAIADSVNAFSPVMKAEAIGAKVRLKFVGPNQTVANSTEGANGNRVGAYAYVESAGLTWSQSYAYLSGGTSPSKWKINLPFAALLDETGATIDATSVRKMRWTYAADFQRGAFERTEFEVQIRQWSVTGTNRIYKVAGPGSRRIEEDDEAVSYLGTWASSKPGNFSGGGIAFTTSPGSLACCEYRCPQVHTLYVGTRAAFNGGAVRITVDGGTPFEVSLKLAGEDVLRRLWVGEFTAGLHQITVEHAGVDGEYLYLDFFEIAIPTSQLPQLELDPKITLATDWDTDHSLALPAERTAWMIHSLGFGGRANHYVGAMWFYELHRKGHQYALGTVTLTGVPQPNSIVSITIGRTDQPVSTSATLHHLVHVGDTLESIAKAFELRLNSGYTSIGAVADGSVLTVRARGMGTDGNNITVSAASTSAQLQATPSGPTLAGGVDGNWYTDLDAPDKLNRACRDWSRYFYRAMAAYGLDVAAAYSTELQHGDPSLEAGIAQRYPSGNAVLLNTPALQTNFSPTSLAFWREVHRETAALMAGEGLVPYLQFGEVQWWYFPYDGSGMPFYDEYTKSQFHAQHGRQLPVILNGDADSVLYAQEGAFLAKLIGDFTDAIMQHVRQSHPNARFEVLYPTDVNDGAFNQICNYPVDSWTPAKLDNLKTESFTYTYSRNLNKCAYSVHFARELGFPTDKRSHLIGIGDPISPWVKEVDLTLADQQESVVLFALDQFCLIGYPASVRSKLRRSAAFRAS